MLTESRQRNSWEELHHAADQVEEGGAKGNESSASKVVEEKQWQMLECFKMGGGSQKYQIQLRYQR